MKLKLYLLSPVLIEALLDFSPLFVFGPKSAENEGNGDDGVSLQTLDDVSGLLAVDPANSALKTSNTSV